MQINILVEFNQNINLHNNFFKFYMEILVADITDLLSFQKAICVGLDDVYL